MINPKSTIQISRFTTIKPLLSLTLCLTFVAVASAQSLDNQYRALTIERVTDGLNKPWSLAFLSDEEWLVTERGGQLRRIVNGELQPQAIIGTPDVDAKGQGGLLDVQPDPNYAQNGWIYLSFAASDKTLFSRSGTEVVRGRIENNRWVDEQKLFVAEPKQRGGRHFGSRLAFDNDGYLYISLGDRGDRDTSQDGQTHAGSVIRLHANGDVPASNPFVGNDEVLNEIFSMGHRNIQGMAYDPQTDTLWTHEHGPQGGDELNKVEAGKNYGWPIITYGVNYGIGTKIGVGSAKEGYEQPATFWDPSIAPSGLALVTSDKYPDWNGNLLIGALKFQLLSRLSLENNIVKDEERLFEGKFGRIRDIRQGPDGYLYFITDATNGGLYKIR
ncbi:MAG: PQQ-dependent sugar dehydrogenase [Granulosicoccus sp.]